MTMLSEEVKLLRILSAEIARCAGNNNASFHRTWGVRIGEIADRLTAQSPAAEGKEPYQCPACVRWVTAACGGLDGKGLGCCYREPQDRDPSPPAQPEIAEKVKCVWTLTDEDSDMWETSCGNAFTIIAGTPIDNDMKFCTYCGEELKSAIVGPT